MKVNIEVQSICVPPSSMRGGHYVVLGYLNSLVKRNNNQYSISFFDYKGERHNRGYIDAYIPEIESKIDIWECNTKNYRDFMTHYKKNRTDEDNTQAYSTYFEKDADIYFFPTTSLLPTGIDKRKSVVTFHDVFAYKNTLMVEEEGNKLVSYRNRIKYIEDRKDILITSVSKYTKNDILDTTSIESERIFVVPNAYDESIYYPESNDHILEKYNIDESYILYLGSLQTYKGVMDLCHAFAGIYKQGIKLVIAGKIESNMKMANEIKQMECSRDIIFTGYVTDEEKRVLLSMAEVFVFPSFYEGFGLPVLEAMACGTPVITTNSSSLPEVGGDAALYFEPGNSEELAMLIDRVLVDADLREEMVKKGYENCKRFSWDKTAEMLEDVFAYAKERYS